MPLQATENKARVQSRWPYAGTKMLDIEHWVPDALDNIGAMCKNRIFATFACCLFAAGAFLWAQARKPGLWEMTATQTWQQSPFPAGANSPFSSPMTHTTQVCLTQEQIDKYGAVVPQTRGCQVTNIVKKADGMTADMECTGAMSGKGTLESHLTDDNHAKGKVHFIGTMKMGPNAKPVEWTVESSSVFKGADCGTVKPVPAPEK